MYMYMYMYLCKCIYVYMYVYIYIYVYLYIHTNAEGLASERPHARPAGRRCRFRAELPWASGTLHNIWQYSYILHNITYSLHITI